jgi:transcriptional regulator with XRE-family HTH domain
MGVEPAHVRRMEQGSANPSLAVLVSVADAFGMSVAELLAPKEAAKSERR